MVSHFREQESLLQDSIFDVLYCEEEHLGVGFGLKEQEMVDFNEIFEKPSFWEDDELGNLLSKEEKQARLSYEELSSLETVRKEAIKWIAKVTAHFGFTAMTTVLAVDFYDRFITSPCFHKDKPWMSQLAAVSCLSIAAKVEEIRVPLLVDLQVDESQYLFEAKTIQKMELLVLSTLQWKMYHVTPISYIDLILRRLGCLQREFWGRCESLFLSIITDCRHVRYLPSVVAAVTMLYACREIESFKALEFQNQLICELKTTEEKIEECHQLIGEILEDQTFKRKHSSIPRSPNVVVDNYFSSESSNDSWVVASSETSSPGPLYKGSRAQD